MRNELTPSAVLLLLAACKSGDTPARAAGDAAVADPAGAATAASPAERGPGRPPGRTASFSLT
jgi:hypothetical protein